MALGPKSQTCLVLLCVALAVACAGLLVAYVLKVNEVRKLNCIHLKTTN